MKTKIILLFAVLLTPCLLHGQVIGSVPQSNVSVNKNTIGSKTEYSLTIYEQTTGYNGEIRLGDLGQAVSLLTKLEDAHSQNIGKIGLDNGFSDSAEFNTNYGSGRWFIYRQNGQVLNLGLNEIKSCKEMIMKDYLMSSPSKISTADISIVKNEKSPSFYLKRSAERAGWTLGLSAVTALSGAIYTVTAANTAASNVKGPEYAYGFISLGTGIAALCTTIGAILDLHRAGRALECIQITSGGVAISF